MSMRKILLALILSTAVGAVAHAAEIRSIEIPVEMSTDCLIMPSSSTGSLACGSRSFQLAADTTYWVGSRALTFGDFSKFLQGLAGHPRNGVVLMSLDRKQVRRVYVSGDAK